MSRAAYGGSRGGRCEHLVARIASAAERMRTLVDDLLADARSRDRALELEPVDLAALVGDATAGLDTPIGVAVDGLPLVHGDPGLLRQLLDNLLGSAIKYVAPGEQPEVRVDAVADQGSVVLRVSDRGIGIPHGQHEQVFHRFARAHQADYPGTGLGLSICHSVVARHGGTVRALPRLPGPGTVVEVLLAAAPSDTMAGRG